MPTAYAYVFARGWQTPGARDDMHRRTSRKKASPGECKVSIECRPGRGFVLAKVRALLRDSGDPTLSRRFDLDAWADEWILAPMIELNGKTPAQVLRYANGWATVERLLERMRGGVCA